MFANKSLSLNRFIFKIQWFFSLTKEHVTAKKSLKRLNFSKLKNSSSTIYVEAYQTPSSRFANAIFANFLAKKTSSSLVAYYQMRTSFFIQLKEQIRFLFSLEKIFGCKKFRIINYIPENESYKFTARQMMSEIKNKEEFLELKYQDILIGDLLYDGYLRWKNRITLDLSDEALVHEISKTLQYIDKWLSLLSFGECQGILVSHTAYNLGVPARVGAYLGIPIFKVDLNQIFKISKLEPFPLHRFHNYPVIFESFSSQKKEVCLAQAKDLLSRKFNGEMGIDIFYGNYSAYDNTEGNLPLPADLLRTIELKTTVLVALHDFVDSPHGYGNMLFADFFEWIRFLDEYSKTLDFFWLLKPHPNSTNEHLTYVIDLCNRNSNFKLIDKGLNNSQLAKLRIDLCLTMYGTIGYEFAYLGVKVLTGCPNTPYGAYNFTQAAKTLDEYRLLISQVDRKVNSNLTIINKKEIREYYYMHYIYNVSSWIVRDFTRYFSETSFYDLYNWKIFSYFFENDNHFNLMEIENILDNFLNSPENSIKLSHLP